MHEHDHAVRTHHGPDLLFIRNRVQAKHSHPAMPVGVHRRAIDGHNLGRVWSKFRYVDCRSGGGSAREWATDADGLTASGSLCRKKYPSAYGRASTTGFQIYLHVQILVGTQYARFSSFVHSRRGFIAYVRDAVQQREPRFIGHNPPAAAVMILVLIFAVITISVTGWMLTTDAYSGR